jgi:uncharacterized protein (DUF1330 family)
VHHCIERAKERDMTRCKKILLSVFAGIVISIAGLRGLLAEGLPTVYMIIDNAVTNEDSYRAEYLPRAQASIKAHGGSYIAGGREAVIDGEVPKGRIVIRYGSVSAYRQRLSLVSQRQLL